MISTGAAILGSAAIGAGASIFGASQAANAQAGAATRGAEIQNQQWWQMRRDLAPWVDAGISGLNQLQNQLPYLTSEVPVLDRAGLEQLPGYQFTRDQGLRAAQNALTSTGMGRSGAAVKAAERFASGLADTTYQNQAQYATNLALTNRANTYNRLMDLAKMGQASTAQTGLAGIQMSQGVANSLMNAGNAQAGGIMAGANAIGNAANSIGSYAMLNQLTNNNQGGMYSGGYTNQFANSPAWAQPGGSWYNS